MYMVSYVIFSFAWLIKITFYNISKIPPALYGVDDSISCLMSLSNESDHLIIGARMFTFRGST